MSTTTLSLLRLALLMLLLGSWLYFVVSPTLQHSHGSGAGGDGFRVENNATEEGGLRRLDSFNRRPLYFEANKGQSTRKIDFLSRGGGHTLSFSPTEIGLGVDLP